jgi:eukaryotic-like serine/threonine-protein kinase
MSDPDALAATIPDQDVLDDAPLARGATVGHFMVLETIGSGAMGTVLLAYDAALDRKVALKLLRPGAWSASATTEGKQRLLREAQAMAKLSHPNVVTAYEVGTFGDRVFLAMEYVAGETLEAWLEEPKARGKEERKRSWREIVQVFLQAGRGLASAHAAGIVHRDFKPENVLISSDGRVRVTDFGLASVVGTPQVPLGGDDMIAMDGGSGAVPSRASGPSSLTRAGALIGTPAYMSPEQHKSQPADARADQFAFAVALYEALYGERPFAGVTYREYADAVTAGRIREGPRGSKVPAWVRRILVRALAVDAGARYGSMDDLLAALASDPAAARRRLVTVGGFAFVVLASAGAVFWLARSKTELCAVSPRAMAGVWDAARKADVEKAFVASGRAAAADTAKRVGDILDQRAAAIVGMRADACRATHDRGEQSPELLDLRIACLDRKTAELRALVDVLSQKPDATIIDNSIEAALSVGKPDACADAQALTAAVPQPADPAVRASITSTREKLARVEALAKTGKYKDAYAVAKEVAAEAEKIAWAPLVADAVYQVAMMESRSGMFNESEASWRRLVRLAAEAKNDVQMGRAYAFLLQSVGYGQQRYDEAAVLEEVAVNQARRAGEPMELMNDLESAIAAFHYSKGDYARAVEMFGKVTDTRKAVLGPEHPATASALANLAQAVGDNGDYARSLEIQKQALAIREKVLGPDHPATAQSLHSMGIALSELRKDDEALATFQRAYDIRVKVLGPEATLTADTLSSIGLVLADQNKVDEALVIQEKVMAIREKTFGPDHPNITQSLSNVAALYMEKGDLVKARELRERVVKIREEKLGPDHPELASALSNLSLVTKRQGDFDGSRKLLERVLEIRIKRLGPDHPDVANAMNNIAYLEVERERWDEADKWYRKAIPIYEKKLGPEHPRLFDTLLYFAETQAQRKNFAEAIDAWQRGLDGYTKYHPDKLSEHDRKQIEGAIAKARAEMGRGKAKGKGK